MRPSLLPLRHRRVVMAPGRQVNASTWLAAEGRGRARYCKLKWSGMVKLPPGTPGGGAGTGLARRTVSTAARSRMVEPELPASRTPEMRPLRSTKKATRAVPLAPCERPFSGYSFTLLIRMTISLFHEEAAAPLKPAAGAAALCARGRLVRGCARAACFFVWCSGRD